MQRLLRLRPLHRFGLSRRSFPLLRPLRRFSTGRPSRAESEFASIERTFRMMGWYFRSLPFAIILGGGAGTIYGSYQYYTDNTSKDYTYIENSAVDGMMMGATWPIIIPYTICKEIGHYLALGKKIKVTIK